MLRRAKPPRRRYPSGGSVGLMARALIILAAKRTLFTRLDDRRKQDAPLEQ